MKILNLMNTKQLIFIFSICFFNLLFSQDARDSYVKNDLKIGKYDSQNNQEDTLGIFIARSSAKKSYSLCLDVFSEKRKDAYSGLGISIDENKLNKFYNTLRVAQKEFQKRLSETVVLNNMKVGDQIPIQIYQWNSKDKNGPKNRIGIDQKKNQKLYPLSIEILNVENQQELWIYTSGESSNPKEVSIVFKSVEGISQFLKTIEPGLVRQQHHNHFKLIGKK